jgi:hypothetical protein
MTVFRWAMRNGAIILFVATLLIFVISFANYFLLTGAALNQTMSISGITQSKFVLSWGSIATALSNSVWPFIGACLLYRMDDRSKEPRG